jgi:valyl-tRNA synthetase
MSNEYDFKEVEQKWRKYWADKKIYQFNSAKKKIYAVDTPPPTVSGRMHIGHAFSYSQQDFIVRYRRMKDGGVFYPFGTDDNGLPTERLVEKLKKVKSKDMSRTEFIELCLKTLKEVTPEFIQDWKDLGISCDFNIHYSTIDKNTQKISQKYFLDLFHKGDAYKQEFPSLWCPDCQTSIAQAELEDKEKETLFSTLKFSSNGKELLIATTRPELLAACVAVFVNPDDKRFKNLIGKKAKVPLFDFEVPIIADKSADPEKGTGVLMICTFGDKYDADAVKRHNLEAKIILNHDGTLKVGDYKGLKVEKAREKILEDLKKKNLITEQKKISHSVNVHDKCGTPIEFLTTEQWFIKLLDKKNDLIEQGKKINWYPQYMFKRYENWVKGLDWDWNISRDRHFGIPIPIWECKKCGEFILPEEDELPVDPLQLKKRCSKCGEYAKGEEKVLDTWATSSLTPQISAELTKNKVKFPFSLRPQAHDIIRTWAFYTIVRSMLHEKKIPWENISISGFVTLGGEKMSKSKGNVIDPIKVIGQWGVDALRFWAASSKLGEDLDYQEKDLLTGKKFITKLNNASKFVFMNLEDYNGEKPKKLVKTDELFLNELNKLIKISSESFESYEYSRSKMETEQFFWKMFADNYLEIVKKRIYQGSGEEKLSAQYVLYQSLLTVLKLMAPIMPYITEEIYQTYFIKNEKEKSIHLSSWPREFKIGKVDENIWNVMIDIISRVRQEKSKAQKSMKAEIELTFEKENIKLLNDVSDDLKSVTGAVKIKEGGFSVKFI